MITINFFKDGAYVKGHDVNEICNVVSYAMWSCINDCYEADTDITHYESATDENKSWKNLGFTFVKFNVHNQEQEIILRRFKDNISRWLEVLEPNKVKIIINKENDISWDEALKDAKQEQKII